MNKNSPQKKKTPLEGLHLVIQIPALNEEHQIAATISNLPQKINGIAKIDVLVIDDGSQDRTVEVARRSGATAILALKRHYGLAHAFSMGLQHAVKMGADIVVNTDADNQYHGEDIAKLVAPIIAGDADMVIGCRPVVTNENWSALKKILQLFGSYVVRKVSGTRVPDAPSGFRAFSRELALKLNVFDRYTYTLDTIIQAGSRNFAIHHIPIRTNPVTRPSRLMRNTFSYIIQSSLTILRIGFTYRPLVFFWQFGACSLLLGCGLYLRFLYYYLTTAGATGKVQSIVAGTTFLLIGILLIIAGVIAELISVNRRLLEDLRYSQQKLLLHHEKLVSIDPAQEERHIDAS